MLFHCSLARNQCSQYLQFAMETFCHLFGSIYLYHRPIFSLRSHIFFLNPPEHVCSNKSQPLLILCYHDVGSQFTPFWHVYAIIRNTFQVFFPVTDHYTLFLKIDCMNMRRLELSWTAINALVNCNHGSCSYDDGILHGESIRKLSWQGSYCLCCSNKHGTAILGSK